MNRLIAPILSVSALGLSGLMGCSKEASVTWTSSFEELDYSTELWTNPGGVVSYDNEATYGKNNTKAGVTAYNDGSTRKLIVNISDSGKGFFGLWGSRATMSQRYGGLVYYEDEDFTGRVWTWGDPSLESSRRPDIDLYDDEDWGTTTLGEPIYFAYTVEEDGADRTYTLVSVMARGGISEMDAEAMLGLGSEARGSTPEGEESSLADLDYFAVSTEILVKNAKWPHEDWDTGGRDSGDEEGGDDGGDDGNDDLPSFLGSWVSEPLSDCLDQPVYFTFNSSGSGYANTPECTGACGYTKYSYDWSGADHTDSSGNLTIHYTHLEGCGYDKDVDQSFTMPFYLAGDGEIFTLDNVDLRPSSSTP